MKGGKKKVKRPVKAGARKKAVPGSDGTNLALKGRRKAALSLALILSLFAFLLYANTLGHDYVLDDNSVITENRITRLGTSGLGEIFSSSYRSGYNITDTKLYRPLPKSVFALHWELAPDNPFPGHLTNVLFFAATIFLIFWVFFLYLNGNLLIPFLSALLFAAHPIHTEVVANIKSLDEIFVFFFFLLSALFLHGYLFKGNKTSLILAVLSFFAGLLSKESSVTLIVVFPLLIYFFASAAGKSRYLMIGGGFALALLLYFVMRSNALDTGVVESGVAVADNLLMSAKSGAERFATAVQIMGIYLLKLLFPHPLVFDRSYTDIPVVGMADWRFLLSLAIHLLLAFIAIVRFAKKDIVSFAILFYAITMSVSSNILLIIGTSYGERLVYTSSFGFCLAFAVLLQQYLATEVSSKVNLNLSQFFKSYNKAILIAVVIAGAYSIKTYSRNLVWKDNYTLYSNDIELAPNSTRTNYYLGNLLIKPQMAEGKSEEEGRELLLEGIAYLQKSIDILGTFSDAHKQMGVAYYRLKDYENAMACYQRALNINPTDAVVHNNMGTVLFETANYSEAQRAYHKAVELDPNYAEAYGNLGSSYGMLNDYQNAIKYLQMSVQKDPGFAMGYYFLGISYQNIGDQQNADYNLSRAYELNPALRK